MVKAEKCIGTNCFTYIRVADGKHKPIVLCQPKKKCDPTLKVSDTFQREFISMIKGTSKTVYTDKEIFKNVKEGEDLEFGLFD